MNWTTFQQEIELLSRNIDLKFDMIVGITRGGVVPARMLSSLLNIPKMACISVEKQEGGRKVITEILEDLTGKTILLVEDMLETGRSLMMAKNYLESKGAQVKTACLYTMAMSEIKPDYFLKEVEGVTEFPWEGLENK